MKLRIIGSRNPSAIFRHQMENISQETDIEDNTEPLDVDPEQEESASDGIPVDMGNRLPSGGRSGNPKIDKFQGYKTPPMY